jgi:hypothetical protein
MFSLTTGVVLPSYISYSTIHILLPSVSNILQDGKSTQNILGNGGSASVISGVVFYSSFHLS